jgi:NAD(P)H-hydrate epimerase
MAGGMKSLTREEVRAVDQRAIEEFHLPGIVLMENAGRGCAELLQTLGVAGPVVICCGKGNNGGDGYVIARHLENAGVEVSVLVFAAADEIRGDAAVNLSVLQAAGTRLRFFSLSPPPAEIDRLLQGAAWVVDALLGTGARGKVREPFRTMIAAINRAAAQILAVDLPSGLDCDTGTPQGGCVRARHTATFVAPKRGFENPGALEYTGDVHVVGIGVPRQLLTSLGL